MAYFDDNNRLQQLQVNLAEDWRHLDLAAEKGAELAAADSDLAAFAWSADMAAHLDYVDARNSLREVVLDASE